MKEEVSGRGLIGKSVIGKSGKAIGVVTDVMFNPETTEIIYLVIGKITNFGKELNFKRVGDNYLIPFEAVVSIGDFVIIDENQVIS